jgi:predicted DNA-binding transcriptional regulator AlpA
MPPDDLPKPPSAPAAQLPPTGAGRLPRARRHRKALPEVPIYLQHDMLLTAREAAAVARLGLSTFWLRVREGHFPAATYAVGPKSPRWRLSELRVVLGGGAR